MKDRKMAATLHTKHVAKILAVLVTAVFGLSLVGCSAADAASAGEETKVAVRVQTAAKGTFETYARNSAKVSAGQEIMVVPKVAGTVKSVNFDIGQKVARGDVLFVIDDADISLQAAQAEAGYLAAQANYDRAVGGGASQQVLQVETAAAAAKINRDNAELALSRTKALFEIGAASQQALEAAQSGFDLADEQYRSASENLEVTKNQVLRENEAAASAALKQAKAAFDLAQRQLENTVVTAEIDGVVGMRTISAGSVVGPQAPVMSLVDISKVTLEFGVSDTIVNQIEAGRTKVELTFSALGDKAFSGMVKAVSPAAGAQSMTYLVKVELDNPGGNVKPGMFASVRVILSSLPDVISLPISAVVTKDEGSYVYVVQEEVAHLKQVTTGEVNETDIVITEGIAEGEMVVVRGQNLLEDLTPVLVAEE